MNLDLNQKTAVVTISGEATLPELSFAVEIAVSNFLGRNATRFQCTRTKLQNGDCQLEFVALCPSGPIVISKVMSLGDAVKNDVYPRAISEVDSFLKGAEFNPVISDGTYHHRGFAQSGFTTSVVENTDTNPQLPLAVISYGLGDMFAGLFALGINYVKWQGSLKKTQLFIQHKLTEQALSRFLTSRQDYDLTRKVKTLNESF